MGTTYSIKVNSERPPSEAERAAWQATAAARLEEVDQLMSTYRADSEVSQLNQAEAGDLVAVSDQTAEVLHHAAELSTLTNGAFDATVGAAVERWGFGASVHDYLPTEQELTTLRELVDYRQIVARDGHVMKTATDVRIDFSALAKGYAVDRVAGALEALGITNYLVEVGGEIRVLGRSAQNEPWRLAIERPSRSQRAIHRVIPLERGCLATSGDYRNSYEVEGRRYSHTIDPRTAAPVTHTTASVSVVAENCAQADGLATALLVMGSGDGLSFAEDAGIDALFLEYVDYNPEASEVAVSEAATTGFERLLSTADNAK